MAAPVFKQRINPAAVHRTCKNLRHGDIFLVTVSGCQFQQLFGLCQWHRYHAILVAHHDIAGLHDHLVEPRRASLIPGFAGVKQAALDAGAMGASISGAGPSVFAWFEDRASAVAA